MCRKVQILLEAPRIESSGGQRTRYKDEKKVGGRQNQKSVCKLDQCVNKRGP